MKRLASFVVAFFLVFAIVPAVFASGGAPAPTKSPLQEAVEGKTFEEAEKALEELNQDNDPVLTPAELGTKKSVLQDAVEGRTVKEAMQNLQALDAEANGGNGDGKLSAKELGAGGGSGKAIDLWMFIGFATVALFFSSICSVAEAVLLSISPSYVATLEKDGKKSAKSIKNVKTNVDRSLAAILTLNTIAHTIGSAGAGAYAAKFFGDQYLGIVTVILTLLILFVSEIVPKTIGAVYWRGLAPLTAMFIQFLNFALYPFIFISELITKWLTGGHSHHVFNRDEFAAMAEVGAQGGHLDEKESRILKNLFRFPDLCAEDIMTPSTVVFALQEDMTAHEVLEKHEKIHFSRIPIYGENRDNVTGFVLKSDLLIDDIRNDGKTKLKDFKKREVHGVLDETRLSTVLEKLLDGRQHILLVVDKYGGMEGVVTLEDVVETLIGIEIVDEADSDVDMRKLAREKWGGRMEKLGIDVREMAAVATTEKASPEGEADAGETTANVEPSS